MCSFLSKNELAALTVKLGPPADELFYVFRALGDKGLDGLWIAQTRTRDESVALMKLGVIIIRQHYGNATLCIFGIRFARLVLCKDGHAGTAPGKLDGRPQSRDAAADHYEIRFQRHSLKC